MKQQGWKEAQKRRVRREEVREEEERKTEGQGARKSSREKSRNTVCFPMFCGPGRSKSRLTKAAGAKASREMRPEKLHTVVARGGQNVKNISGSEHFWKLKCGKVHGVVARSTSRSQKVQNASALERFRTLSWCLPGGLFDTHSNTLLNRPVRI